jgi:hypothetical protein
VNFTGGNGYRCSTRSSALTRPGDAPDLITARMTQDHRVRVFLQIVATYAHDGPSSNNNEHVVA